MNEPSNQQPSIEQLVYTKNIDQQELLSIKSCRICLLEARQHGEDEQQNYISPCRCSGSLQYVHHSCLIKWVNSIVVKNLKEGKNTQRICCQICKEPYEAQRQNVIQILSCAEMKQIYRFNTSNKFVFFLGIFFLVCSLTVFITLMIIFNQQQKMDENERIALILALTMVVGVFFIWTIKLISTFVIKRISYYSTIANKEKRKIGKQNVRDSTVQMLRNNREQITNQK